MTVVPSNRGMEVSESTGVDLALLPPVALPFALHVTGSLLQQKHSHLLDLYLLEMS